MAKIYRPFYIEFWDDDKLPFMPDRFRLVFLHVVFNRYSTNLGIYYAPLATLHANFSNKNREMLYETYAECFREGLAKGFWNYDERFEVVFIEQWWKADDHRNRPGNPNVLANWIRRFDDIPQCELKDIAIDRVRAFSELWGKPFEMVCRSLPKALPQPFRVASPNKERGKRKEEKKDKDVPAPKTKTGGGNVENFVDNKTKSRHFELMDLATRTFKAKYPKFEIKPAQVSILAYGRGGGRKGPCFGEIDVVVELFKQMPSDLTDPVRFAMKMASEPEWISKCTNAVMAKERTGPQVITTEPTRMGFGSVVDLPAKPMEVE